MANLNVLDAAEASKYLKTSGAGTDVDPHVPEHLESNSADILTAAEAIQAAAEAIQTAVETLDNIVSGSEAQVDVLTSALPSGAATAALQTSSEALLTTIDADTSTLAGAVDGTEVQADIVSSALPTGAATAALQTSSEALLTTIDADTGAIKTAVETLDDAISGSEMQVDVVAALPAGTNAIGKLAANSGVDIGDVDVTSVTIPTTVYNGQETVDSAGTAQAIGSSQAILSGVTVKALAGNSGIVYVGNSSVAAANGFELSAGEQVFIEAANVATVYVDSAENDDGVSWIAS
jgi:hypothetical protein